MKFLTTALILTGALLSNASQLDKRIVTSGSPASYPFLVNLVTKPDAHSTMICLGALISSHHLVTSASCVAQSVSDKSLPPNQLVVGTGYPRVNMTNAQGQFDGTKLSKHGFVFPQLVHVHPGYRSAAHTDNIAVVTLAAPLKDAKPAQLIVPPSNKEGSLYAAVGWSPSQTAGKQDAKEQVELEVASNATCSQVWAPYKDLTNSLCLEPTDLEMNVCGGDAVLVKSAEDGQTVGLAGLLNVVGKGKTVPTAHCKGEGVMDYFTTFGNYVGWIGQVTKLQEEGLVSHGKFDYTKPDFDQPESSSDEESQSEEDASSEQTPDTTSGASKAWQYKKPLVLATGGTYLAYNYWTTQQKQKRSQIVVDGTVLWWRIHSESIVESARVSSQGTNPLLGRLNSFIHKLTSPSDQTTMLKALVTLEMAAEDPRVKSLCVRVAANPEDPSGGTVSAGLGVAQVQELRQAVQKFQQKKPGCRTYFYIDSFDDQATYYLASAFTNIVVQPSGYVPLVGLSSTQFFYKRVLDKLGIRMNVQARHEYKGMVAPFVGEGLSEELRENLGSLLSGLNTCLAEDIAEDHKTSADVVRMAMEKGPLQAPEAQTLGLVTETGFLFDVESIVGPRKFTNIHQYGQFRRKELMTENQEEDTLFSQHGTPLKPDDLKAHSHRNLRLLDPSRPITVGVVYLLDGIGRHGQNSGVQIARHLLTAARDPAVSSIILRVDSGGGDVVASETIGAAIEFVQEKYGKPVVASFSNVAASGAYFAGTACDRIFSSPGTVTGSIGVAAMRPQVTQGLLDLIGVNVEELYVTDNRYQSMFREMSPEDMEKYKGQVDQIYKTFTERVGRTRGLSGEQVDKVARGRVFTGQQALGNGLVDEMGGFTRAIEAAAQLGFDRRELIVRKMFPFFHQRKVNKEVRRVTETHGLSVEQAMELIKKADITDSVPEHVEKQIAEINKLEMKYAPDICQNIRIKEFPGPSESLASWAIGKLTGNGGGDPQQLMQEPATMGSFDRMAAGALSVVIRQEIQAMSKNEPEVKSIDLNVK